jgi:hypothetical protein
MSLLNLDKQRRQPEPAAPEPALVRNQELSELWSFRWLEPGKVTSELVCTYYYTFFPTFILSSSSVMVQ